MNCYLCKDAGRGEQVAHRIVVVGGKPQGVCNDHYQGALVAVPSAELPAETVAVAATSDLASRDSRRPVGKSLLTTVHEWHQEEKMERKQIDLVAFKRDYETGIPAKELEAKYGIGFNCSAYWAKKAGAQVRCGGKPAANGGKPRSARVPKVHRRAAQHAPSAYCLDKATAIGWLTRQRDAYQAAIDSLSALP